MPSTYANLNVHVVFSTKRRAPIIADAWREELHAYIGGTVRGLGAIPHAVGGVADHVHLVAGIRPIHCLADFVRDVKRASSSWSSDHLRDFGWQEGYGAFSVSYRELGPAIAYVANQEQHHRKVTSEEEFRALLAECGMTVDERFFE